MLPFCIKIMPVQVRQPVTLRTEVLMNYASMKESAMLLKLMETLT